MKIINLFIVIAIGLISTKGLSAQEQELKKGKVWPSYTVAVQPLYLPNGGLRIDVEKQLKDHKQWIQVGIAGYYLPQKDLGTNEYWETFGSYLEEFNGLKGAGAFVNYKSFVPTSNFFYTSYGLSYNYYKVKYESSDYVPYSEDGLTFYEYKDIIEDQNFNKVSGNVCIGIQTSLRYRIFLDTYVGLAYTYSFYDKDKVAFDENIFGYGYRGVTLTGGVRLGFTFK